MNAPSHHITEPTLEDLKAEVQALKAQNVNLSEHNVELGEEIEELQGTIAELREEMREILAERNTLRRTAPARLLKKAVIEYRELVEEGETNKYVWMGVESHLDRALEQVRV